MLSYLTFVVNNSLVISGSTITGLTEATLYLFNCVTILCLVMFVKVEPDAALIAILTTPYWAVSSSSPPQAETDWAFG